MRSGKLHGCDHCILQIKWRHFCFFFKANKPKLFFHLSFFLDPKNRNKNSEILFWSNRYTGKLLIKTFHFVKQDKYYTPLKRILLTIRDLFHGALNFIDKLNFNFQRKDILEFEIYRWFSKFISVNFQSNLQDWVVFKENLISTFNIKTTKPPWITQGPYLNKQNMYSKKREKYSKDLFISFSKYFSTVVYAPVLNWCFRGSCQKVLVCHVRDVRSPLSNAIKCGQYWPSSSLLFGWNSLYCI